MAMIWSPKLVLGIESIDREHQQLVVLINELDAAIKSGKGNQVVAGAVDKLAGYTVMHFGREEKLFAQHAYAESAAHKVEHKAFVDKVAEFKSGIERGRLGLSFSIMTYLEEWIQKHILTVDRKYVPFMMGKGVK